MNTPTTTDDDAVSLLDRNLYRTIKKMDRNTLEGLLNDLFERGRKKGLAEAGVIVPVEILNKLGKPLYFHIGCKAGDLLLIFEDEMSENSFDIPKKVYNGKWKGVQVHGGEFGHALCVEMGVRHYLDLLESTPEIDLKHRVIVIPLDELERSSADIVSADFLLPQWQYEEFGREDDEW